MKPVSDQMSAHEKRAVIRSMFKRIAPTYDLLNRLLSISIDRIWRRKTIRLMELSHQSVVLDLACGTGDLSQQAVHEKAMTIFALDPAREMLERARFKLKYSLTRLYYLEAFGEELPLASNLCTHAMIGFGIRNVVEREKAFSELYRILRSGGILAVLEFTPMDKGFGAFLFNLYFNRILPAIGGFISRDRPAYEYLPQSVARFTTVDGLVSEAEKNGFKLKIKNRFLLGIATAIIFEK